MHLQSFYLLELLYDTDAVHGLESAALRPLPLVMPLMLHTVLSGRTFALAGPARASYRLSGACLLQVMKQLPVFRKLVQEAAEGNDESEDIAKGLARVFAEVGEAYVSLISAGRHPPT